MANGLSGARAPALGAPKALVTHNVRDFEAVADSFGLTVVRPGPVVMEIKR